MRSINAKRIIAIVAGAALFGTGIAFAGQLTYQNVPIISNSGQPMVQVVVGSNSKPSDGIAAGNIAAAIGNLAYTTTPVTASVDQASLSALKVSSSNSNYSLSNQQVWLNESGVTSATGASYIFSALIGSVLNQGIVLGSQSSTKSLQGGGSSYAFTETSSTTASPISSPYVASDYVPNSGFSNVQGGGVTFDSFTNTIGSQDNILQVSSSQLSVLKNNWGSNGETEYLWLTGFPAFDAESGVNQFTLQSAGGAYQIIFNNPIENVTSSNSPRIDIPISLLGQNYTIIKEKGVLSGVSSGSYVAGGSIELASSISPLETVYVGDNLTSGLWQVQLQDLAQTTSGTNDAAAVAVYYNGVLTNESSINSGTTTTFNVSGHLLYLDLNSTFAGLYAYQKWAKMQLYTNIYNITNNHELNSTTDPGWYTNLLWTNTSSGTKDNALYSIIIRNESPETLMPGQSFSFIQNPSAYKLTFEGDTLGSNNYDQVHITSQSATNGAYENLGKGGTTTISNITEPEQILQVQSQIPNAFSFAGQSSSTVDYLLNPFEFTTPASQPSTTGGTNVTLAYNNPTGGESAWINPTQQLYVNIQGYRTGGAGEIQENLNFSSTTGSQTMALPEALENITSIQIQGNKVLPITTGGSLSLTVTGGDTSGNPSGTTIGVLNNVPAGVIYTQSGISNYQGFTSAPSVIYNQWKGQPTTALTLTPVADSSPVNGGSDKEYYTLQLNEYPVPSSTSYTDSLGVGIFNTTSSPVGQASPQYILNYSESGTRNNVTYISSQGSTMQVQSSFRTEKGSQIQSISAQSVTFAMATTIDQLQFDLSNSASNSVIGKAYTTFGPYSIGQTSNLGNVTIANIKANIAATGSSISTITGEGNLTATPSVTEATTPVLLSNLPTSPLVVSDANANSGMNLILVGSGYVNTLSAALQSQYNLNISANSPVISGQAYGTNRILVAGYTANETTEAANSFIEQLYAAAASNS